MGIDAGISVVKQITDERKWFIAMEAIQQAFQEEEYFTVLPRFDAVKFVGDNIKKFELEEEMNFSKKGVDAIDWCWRNFPYEWDLVLLNSKLQDLKKSQPERTFKNM